MDINLKRQKIERWVKLGIGLVVAVLVSPFVFLAVKGIVGLALAALVGGFCLAMSPVVAMKFANWRLKGIKAEAAENPIETLQNQLVAARKDLEDSKVSLVDKDTAVLAFKDMVTNLEREYPNDSDTLAFKQSFNEAVDSQEEAWNQWNAAKRETDLFEEEIAKANKIWKVAQADAALRAKLGKGVMQDPMEKIKRETAIEAVRVIQGDGVNPTSIKQILETLKAQRISAENIAFGMGGALLQQVNRDTFSFAMKASAIYRAGEWHDVVKKPVTDSGKNSRGGRLSLVYNPALKRYQTKRREELVTSTLQDELVPVFLNGELLVDDSFETIRKRALEGAKRDL